MLGLSISSCLVISIKNSKDFERFKAFFSAQSGLFVFFFCLEASAQTCIGGRAVFMHVFKPPG